MNIAPVIRRSVRRVGCWQLNWRSAVVNLGSKIFLQLRHSVCTQTSAAVSDALWVMFLRHFSCGRWGVHNFRQLKRPELETNDFLYLHQRLRTCRSSALLPLCALMACHLVETQLYVRDSQMFDRSLDFICTGNMSLDRFPDVHRRFLIKAPYSLTLNRLHWF